MAAAVRAAAIAPRGGQGVKRSRRKEAGKQPRQEPPPGEEEGGARDGKDPGRTRVRNTR